MSFLNDKVILITGGTGSWGNELVRQILEKHSPKEIRIYSRGEHKQVEMKSNFNNNTKLKFIIGDVRDIDALDSACKNVDFLFHLAALKHVPVCEENTWEAVMTNIYGTQNVILSAIKNNVKKVIDISTDKAVDPFNHYGVTKAVAEKMIVNANINYSSETKFVCVRGGNVLGTNGSVLPLFKKQVKENNFLTITDPEMTRYLMSTKEAISLVFEAVETSVGGEIYVMRMSASTVETMADAIIEIYAKDNVEKKIIGSRPGEKKHEVLVSKNESIRTKIFNDKYYVILPQFVEQKIEEKYRDFKNIDLEEFTSLNAEVLSKEELIKVLLNELWIK